MARGPQGRGGWTGERSAAGGGNPWIIASVVSLSTFMEVLDTSIANVSLRHIAGGLSASYDEATWVLTSYLIANAITVPVTSWLSSVIGRKRYYMMCVAGFGASSLLCGLAPSLSILILARIVQGLCGGGLQPTTQSILVDTFPPHQRGSAMALFGLTVILAPTIGPTLGGLITDNISWHWIFLINVPIAILSLFLVQAMIQEPEALKRQREQMLARGLKLDVIGFALVVIGLGALEYTMDRGEREDWFSSTTIQISAVLAVLGLVGFVVRELTANEPLLDLRLFKNRNFAVANVVIGVVGVILFGTTQFLPQFLQQVMGYTATMTGYAMTAGGFATLIAMPLSGVLSNKLQPRWLLAFSLAIESYALWRLTHLTGSISFSYAAQMRVWIAVGIPFLFVPLSSAAYVGLPPDKSAQGAAMMSISRNLGGSMGISLVQTFLAHSQQWHQAHMVERLNPLNPAYQQGLRNIAGMLMANGASAGEAKQAAVGVLYSGVLRQAAILSYIDMFWLLTIFVGCIAPLVFFLKATPGRGGAR